MRILLVEDDESIREVFKMILEAEQPLAGVEVVTASTGAEAVSLCNAEPRPDLVLLDLTLEDEDGFTVYSKIRAIENCDKIPVVAVTAHNISEMQSQAMSMGFAGFVTKPIDFEASLFPLLRKLLAAKPTQVA